MTGPNSGPGHNSLLVYIEGQLDYVVRGITTILDNNLRYLDVREDVQRRYNERIQQRLTKTTWMSGCSSWYLTKDGFNASMYPGFATQYLRQMRDFRFADYDAVEQAAVGVSFIRLNDGSRPTATTQRPAPSPEFWPTCGAHPSAFGASRGRSSKTRCPSFSTRRSATPTVRRSPGNTASTTWPGWPAPRPATSGFTATAGCYHRRCGSGGLRCTTTPT